jgi:RNA polymerase sigma factor (sigma-70 family)
VSSGGDYDDEVTRLYRKSAGKVQGFLIRMGCDPGLAEEITDDAFVGARRYWEHVRTLDEPEGYVFKIARHERGRRQRAHDARARDLHPDPAEVAPGIGEDFAQGVADRAAVLRAVQQLPPRLREAVVLRHIEDLSETTTAHVMGVSLGSVKRFTSEGRARLRQHLDEFRASEEGTSDDRER